MKKYFVSLFILNISILILFTQAYCSEYEDYIIYYNGKIYLNGVNYHDDYYNVILNGENLSINSVKNRNESNKFLRFMLKPYSVDFIDSRLGLSYIPAFVLKVPYVIIYVPGEDTFDYYENVDVVYNEDLSLNRLSSNWDKGYCYYEEKPSGQWQGMICSQEVPNQEPVYFRRWIHDKPLDEYLSSGEGLAQYDEGWVFWADNDGNGQGQPGYNYYQPQLTYQTLFRAGTAWRTTFYPSGNRQTSSRYTNESYWGSYWGIEYYSDTPNLESERQISSEENGRHSSQHYFEDFILTYLFSPNDLLMQSTTFNNDWSISNTKLLTPTGEILCEINDGSGEWQTSTLNLCHMCPDEDTACFESCQMSTCEDVWESMWLNM